MIWIALGGIPILIGIVIMIVDDWRAFLFAICGSAVIGLAIVSIAYGAHQLGWLGP